MIRSTTHAALAALLGASLLLAAPGAADAKEKKEKHWKGGRGADRRAERVVVRERGERGVRREWRQVKGDRVVRRDYGDRVVRREKRVVRKDWDRVSRRDYGDRVVRRDYGDRVVRRDYGDRVVRRDRDRVVRSERIIRRDGNTRGFTRQWRSWQGRRVYREVITIRDGGPRYRAWRAYCAPEYNYARRIIYVRPVRFYVAASAIIGGVHIRARYHDDDDYLYGCNFCDHRFTTYVTYHRHIDVCSHRPHGYRVVCSEWDAPSSGGWWDDRYWEGDRDYRDYGYDEDEYYDEY